MGKYILLTLTGKYLLLIHTCFVLGRKYYNPAGEPAQKKAQVARGRGQSISGYAQQEIFKPENDSQNSHLIAKLNHGMKRYIVTVAQFKKMVTTDQGTLEERIQSKHFSTPMFNRSIK